MPSPLRSSKERFEYLMSFFPLIIVLMLSFAYILLDFTIGSFPDRYNTFVLIFIITFFLISIFQFFLAIDRKISIIDKKLSEGNPEAILKNSGEIPTYVKLINDAENDILLVGNSFVGLLSTESHSIIRTLEKGVQIRVVVPNPDNEQLIKSFSGIKQKANKKSFQNDIYYSIDQLIKLSELTQNTQGKLCIRISDFYITATGLCVDNKNILYSLVNSETTRVQQNIFFTIDKRVSPELFSNLESSLELQWQIAKTIDKQANVFNIDGGGSDVKSNS